MRRAARLFSLSAVILAARLAGAAIMVAVQILIVRSLGPASLGHYVEAAAAINLLAAAMPLGFNIIASYFAVEYAAKQDGGTLRRFIVRAYAHVALTGAAALAAGLIASPIVFAPGSAAAEHWPALALMAVAIALVYVSGAVLAALRRPLLAFLGDGLLRPLAAALASIIAVMTIAPDAAIGAMLWIMATLYLCAALVYVALVIAAVMRLPAGRSSGDSETRRWWRYAMPWVLMTLATEFFFDIDALLLAGHLDYETLAVFGVVARIFALAAFGVGAVYTVGLPDVFEAEARGERTRFIGAVTRTNMAATALVIALIAGVILFSPLVLRLFGDSFVAGARPLAVLCLALLARTVFGPAALVLSIHERPWAPLPAVALGIAALAAGNAALVPAWGLDGAALAAALAITLWSVALWLIARRMTGTDVSVFPALLSALRKPRAA